MMLFIALDSVTSWVCEYLHVCCMANNSWQRLQTRLLGR